MHVHIYAAEDVCMFGSLCVLRYHCFVLFHCTEVTKSINTKNLAVCLAGWLAGWLSVCLCVWLSAWLAGRVVVTFGEFDAALSVALWYGDSWCVGGGRGQKPPSSKIILISCAFHQTYEAASSEANIFEKLCL